MIKKIINAARAHKFISVVIIVVIIGGGYYWYQKAHATTTVTKYVVQSAAQGSVIADVSGTGQVQAGTTISLTPKVSEEVVSIPVTVGQHVGVGQLLVQLDSTNEQRALNQAQLSLEQAQLSLQVTQQISTTTLLQEQNAVTTGEQAVVNASTTLDQDYQAGFNSLASTFANFQTIMTGLQNFVQGYDISKIQQDPDAFVSLMPSYLQAGTVPYKDALQAQYDSVIAVYQQNLTDYHNANPTESPAAMDSLFTETLNTAQSISDTVKAGKDFLSYIVDTYPTASDTNPLPPIINTLQNNLGTYTTSINSAATGLQGTITGIATDKNNIINTNNSLQQASETLNELLAGPTQTTLLGQQISVQSAQNALTTAQQNLDYTSVRAPIAGTVSAIGATIGETGGANAVTIVSDGEIAQVTLNEIDAAKVAVGDKATLTFDAISNLSLAGQVVEVDPVGTVSQGVVSYGVQVSFSQPADTSSSMLVKPGMSVTADIVTAIDQNVIAVPNAAIVTSGGSSYILEPATPLSASDLASSGSGGIVLPATKQVPVTVGLTNSTMSEITSGVNVGDQIIVQTVKSTTATASAGTGSNALQLLGGAGAARGGGGGGAFVRPGG